MRNHGIHGKRRMKTNILFRLFPCIPCVPWFLVFCLSAARADDPVGRLGDDRFRTGSAKLALTPDGTRAITVAQGRIVRTWDAATGRLLSTTLLPGSSQQEPKLSADGKLLLREPSIHCSGVSYEVWDLQSNKLLRTIRPKKGYLDRIAFANDGKTVAIGEEDSKNNTFHIFIWDVTTGAARLLAGAEVIGRNGVLTFSPDRTKLIAFGSERNLGCWDVASGKLLWKVPERDAYYVAFPPDGRTLAVGEEDRTKGLRFRNMANGQLVTPKRAPPVDARHPVRFSHDGRRLILRMNRGTQVWDTETGRSVSLDITGWADLDEMAFTPDGAALLGIVTGRLQRWDATTGKPVFPTVAGHMREMQLAFSPDGTRLVSLSWNGVCLWDVKQRKQLHSWPMEDCFNTPAFFPDGQRLVWKTRSGLRVRDAETGRELAKLSVGDAQSSVDIEANTPRIAPNSRECTMLVPYGRDNRSCLLIWDLGQKSAAPKEEQLTGFCSALSPDLRLIFTRRRMEFRDAVGLAIRGSKHFRELDTPLALQTNAVFSPDGRLIALPATRYREPEDSRSNRDLVAILIWECATGNLVAQIPVTGPGFWMPPMAFDDAGRTLVFAADDGLRRWDLSAGKELNRVKVNLPWAVEGERPFAESLAVSPDGRLATSGHFDGSILLWDLPAAPKATPPTDAELQSLLTDLRNQDAGKAWAAVHRLAAHPDRAVPKLREILKTVRAPADAVVSPLIDDLDSPSFPKREAATRRLKDFSEGVEGHLRRALAADASPEKRRRLAALLADLDPFLQSGNALAAVRTVAALEKAGTPEDGAVLTETATAGTTARVKREVESAIPKMWRAK